MTSKYVIIFALIWEPLWKLRSQNNLGVLLNPCTNNAHSSSTIEWRLHSLKVKKEKHVKCTYWCWFKAHIYIYNWCPWMTWWIACKQFIRSKLEKILIHQNCISTSCIFCVFVAFHMWKTLTNGTHCLTTNLWLRKT